MGIVGTYTAIDVPGYSPVNSSGPKPQCLDLVGGHHSALLFLVHAALDGGKGSSPPQGAHLEGAPSRRRGCNTTWSSPHAPVSAFCSQLWEASRPKTGVAKLGWMGVSTRSLSKGKRQGIGKEVTSKDIG